MVNTLIFDWGGTVMQDFGYPGKMKDWPHVALVSAMEDALKKLTIEYTCVIATNAGLSGTSDMIEALKRMNADHYFKFFFSSQDLGYKKPDPRFFLAIIQSLAIKADQCVMIGNSYEKDIVGAKLVGMKTIFYNPSNVSKHYKEADIVISTMNDLCSSINVLKR